MMRRILVPLMIGFVLSAVPVVADEASHKSLSVLIAQAKKARADDDDRAYISVMEQVYEHVTGFPASATEPPKGVSEEVYLQKTCEFERIVEQITTSKVWMAILASVASATVSQGQAYNDNDPMISDCVWEPGRPVPTRQLMRDGIAWAKTVRAADADDVRALKQKYEKLAEQHPNNHTYTIRASIAHSQDMKNKLEEASQMADELLSSNIFFKATLVEKAYKGDLSAQFEVARRLEAGDKFKQHNAKAYYWYQRAAQNGGGGDAQRGIDRLRPLLHAGDWASIDIWVAEGHRPY